MTNSVGAVGDWLAIGATAYAIPDRGSEWSVFLPVPYLRALDLAVATLTHAIDLVGDTDVLVALSVPDIYVARQAALILNSVRPIA